MTQETEDLYTTFKLQLGMAIMKIESRADFEEFESHLNYTGDFKKLYPEGIKDSNFFKDSLIWVVEFYLSTDNLLDKGIHPDADTWWSSTPNIGYIPKRGTTSVGRNGGNTIFGAQTNSGQNAEVVPNKYSSYWKDMIGKTTLHKFIARKTESNLKNTHLSVEELERDMTICLMMSSIEKDDFDKFLNIKETARKVMKSLRLYKNTKKLKSIIESYVNKD